MASRNPPWHGGILNGLEEFSIAREKTALQYTNPPRLGGILYGLVESAMAYNNPQ